MAHSELGTHFIWGSGGQSRLSQNRERKMTQELDEADLPEATWIVFLVTVIIGCIVVRVYGPEKSTTQLENNKTVEIESNHGSKVAKSNLLLQPTESTAGQNEDSTLEDETAVRSSSEVSIMTTIEDQKPENSSPSLVYALGSGISHGVCNQLSAFVVIGEGQCQEISLHFIIPALRFHTLNTKKAPLTF